MLTFGPILEHAVRRHTAGDLAAAAAGYRVILAAAPAHADALHLLAMAQARGGAGSEPALAGIRRALAVAPDLFEARANRARLAWDSGSPAIAAADARIALALRPERAELWTLLGRCHLAEARLDNGLSALAHAGRLAPTDPAPPAFGAEAAEHWGRFGTAEALWREVVRRAPLQPDGHLGLARLLERLGRVHEALALHELAARLADGTPAAAATAAERDRLAAVVGRRSRVWSALADGTRIGLRDLSILIPFRLDFPERLRNLRLVLRYLTRTCAVTIRILEDAPDRDHRAVVLEGIDPAPCRVVYDRVTGNRTRFIHRTWQLNRLVEAADTPFVAIWDTDVLIDPAQILDARDALAGGAGIVRPYSGVFLGLDAAQAARLDRMPVPVPEALAALIDPDRPMHPASVGGAVLFDRARLLAAGGYNEHCIAYGYEDDEIVSRMATLGHPLVSVHGPLWHLDHPRSPANSADSPLLPVNRAIAAATAAMPRAEIQRRAGAGAFRRPFLGTEGAELPGAGREEAHRLFAMGVRHAANNPPAAAACYRRALAFEPRMPEAWFNLATALEQVGRHRRAADAYRNVHHLAPGQTPALDRIALCAMVEPDVVAPGPLAPTTPTRRLVGAVVAGDEATVVRELPGWLADPAFGEYNLHRAMPLLTVTSLARDMAAAGIRPARRRPYPGKPRLGVSSLAFFGRLAHTVENYLVARLCAERMGFELETPDWQGHCLFELDDPRFNPDGLTWADCRFTLRDRLAGGFADVLSALADHDLFSPHSPDVFRVVGARRVRGWLRLRPHWQDRLDRLTGAVFAPGRTVVAMHIRLGDLERAVYKAEYGHHDDRPYAGWLADHWGSLDDPLLYIASDEPARARAAFAHYRPLTVEDLPDVPSLFTHLVDFRVLMRAHVLAVSRGAFGRTAAALNTGARAVLRSDPAAATLVPFDPYGSGQR